MSAPQHVLTASRRAGTSLRCNTPGGGFGKGQIIRRLANGAYVAGSEPRADGCAVGI